MNEKEDALWQASDLPGVTMLRARYRLQRFPRHTHDTYVIGVNERGAHASWFRGGRTICPERKVLIVPPGEVHSGESLPGHPWHYRAMYVAPELMAEATGIDRSGISGISPIAFRAFDIADDALVRRFLRVHRLCETGTDSLASQGALLDLLEMLVSRHGMPSPVREEPKATRALRRVRDYLHARGDRRITLDTLASIAGLSRFHVLRAFKLAYGLTPHAWLTQLRIERVKTLLTRGESPALAAVQAGFSDQSHMHRVFRRLVGVTPGTYARAMARHRRGFAPIR